MIEISNRYWRPQQHKCRDTPLKAGIDHAMGQAFPLLEGEFPERIARAIESLVASETRASGIVT